MSTQPNLVTPFQNLTPADLKDPTLFKLNNDFILLWNKISAIYGSGGNVSLGANITMPMAYVTGESQPPTNLQALLTLGAANQLYAPNTTRSALIFGTTTTQPLPGSGGGTSPSSGLTILEASDYCGGAGLNNSCINAAIAALPSTGGAIHCHSGTWSFSGPVNCNLANVIIFGDGYGTIFLRTAGMPAGQGMFDITVPGISIQTCQINGNVASPTGLQYLTAPPNGFNVASPETGSNIDYPLASTLTGNTSIWVHGGANNFSLYGTMITQSGGYAVLIDASLTNIQNVIIANNFFTLNKPHLFGSSSMDLNYGAWTGGVFYCGGTYQSGAGTLSYLSGLNITNNRFLENNGNCVWGYSPQLYVLHQNISVTGNYFQDCGLDGTEIGASQNVVVGDNTYYRVGYINGTPNFLSGYNAVAMDTAGFVRAVKYSGNTVFQVNGFGASLDGFADGVLANNTIANASAADPYYTSDQVDLFALGGQGVQTNSTYDLRGGANVSITGNAIRNMNYNSIVLFNNRSSIVSGNTVAQAPFSLAGTVNTSGVDVTWVSGSKFTSQLVGVTIYINTSPYTIATFVSSTSLTLTGSAGTQSGVIYFVSSGIPIDLANNVLSGTVNTVLDVVTWVSGDKFDTNLDGTYTNGLFLDNGYNYITINGLQYQISAVPSATSMLLTGIAGSQSGVAFEIGKLQNNTVTANQIFYSDDYYTNASVCIYEDSTYGAVYGPNYIYNNNPVGNNLGEVGLSTASPNSSRSRLILSTNAPFAPNPLSQSILQREGTSSSAVTKIYSTETGNWMMQLGDVGPIMNVSTGGGTNTGAYTTSGRTTFGVLVDYLYTGKTIVDGYSVYGMYNLDTSFYNTETNSLTDSFGLIRYRRTGSVGTGGVFEYSVSASGGSRVWAAFGTGGSGSPGGGDTNVQYNKSSSFGGDGNFVYNYGAIVGGLPAQDVIILGGTGQPAYAALVVTDSNSPHSAYIQSDGGFLSSLGNGSWTGSGANTQVVNIPNGGVYANTVTVAHGLLVMDKTATTPSVSGSNQAILYMTASAIMVSQNGGAYAPLATSSAAAPNTGVQVNSSGAFAAYSTFTYNSSTFVLAVSGTGAYVQSGGFVATTNSWEALNGAGSGAGAYMAGYVSAPYGSTGGYVDIAPLGYANFPVVLTGSGGFGATDALLWVSTSNATVTPVTAVSLNTNTYIDAAAGFYTAYANSQAIQAPNGGFYGQTLSLEVASPSGTNYPTATFYASSGPRGRIFGPVSSSANLFISQNLSWSGSAWDADGTSASYAMIQLSSVASGVTFAIYGGYATSNPVSIGASLTVNTIGNVGVQGNPSITAGQGLTVTGTSGQPGLIVSGGYAQTDQGFYTSSSSVTAINIPSGGAQFGLDVQARNVFMLGQSGTPAIPTAGYGGITWSGTGAIYQIWDETTPGWLMYNFATTGAVSSVSGSGAGISVSPTTGVVVVSNTGVTSAHASTGISVSATSGSVTITNTGVTSLGGSTGALSLIAGTGVSISGLTISIGQAVATSSNVQFNTLYVASGATNAVQVVGGIDANAVYCSSALFNAFSTAGGLQVRTANANVNDLTSYTSVVIDNDHTFVGTGGVNCRSNGVTGTGFNPFVGGTLYTGAAGPYTLNWSLGFTIGATTYHNIEIAGGVVVGIS